MKPLLLLALFSLALSLAACGPEGTGSGSGGTTTDRQLQFCGGVAVDVMTSASHCGECNNSCDGGTCSAGRCQGGVSSGGGAGTGSGALPGALAEYIVLLSGVAELWIYKDWECPCFADEMGLSETECLAGLNTVEAEFDALGTCIRDTLSDGSAPAAPEITACLQSFNNEVHGCRDLLSTCTESAEWEFDDCTAQALQSLQTCADNASTQELNALDAWLDMKEDDLEDCGV